MRSRGRTTHPEAVSIVAEQCAVLCAISIYPHRCWVVGCSLSIRAITSPTASEDETDSAMVGCMRGELFIVSQLSQLWWPNSWLEWCSIVELCHDERYDHS
jgi:hypothetical protein